MQGPLAAWGARAREHPAPYHFLLVSSTTPLTHPKTHNLTPHYNTTTACARPSPPPPPCPQDNVAESTNIADAAWLTKGGTFEAFMARGPCTCKEKNSWGLIPRVWLPRGFFHRRLQEPYVSAASAEGGSGGSSRKRKRESLLLISTPTAPVGLAAAADALPVLPAAPPVHTIGAEFGVAADLFAPAPRRIEGAGGGGGSKAGGAAGGSGEEEQGGVAEEEEEEEEEKEARGAAQAAAAAQQPLCHSWYVAEVLEHRLKRGKAGAHEFRVRWVGLRPNDRRHRAWHPFSMFATFGAEGCMPGETTCTLVDAKIGAFMQKQGIAL